MPLPSEWRAQFGALLIQAKHGNLALVDAVDTRSGLRVPTVVRVSHVQDEVLMQPVATLLPPNAADYMRLVDLPAAPVAERVL